MPSPKELAKALAYRGEIRNTPQNSFLGGVANFLAPVSEFADQYKISDRIPFLGGMSAADLTGLKGAQSLVNDMSYGKSPISGASLQTTKVDPRVIDLAGVSGAMMPVGKAALREGARQIETGTGVLGRNVIDPRQRMFAGEGAKTADKQALKIAKDMKAAGVPDEQIHAKTKWTFGFADGKPRFEIDDSAAKGQFTHLPPSTDRLAEQAISHPRLYREYPELSQLNQLGLKEAKESGSFSPTFTNDEYSGGSILAKAPNETGIKSVGLHELQHAIQQREGFAKGGNPSDFKTKAIPRRLKGVAFGRDMREMAISQRLSKEGLPIADGKYHNLNDPKIMGKARALAESDPVLANYLDEYISQSAQLEKYPTAHQQYRRLAGEAEARLTQARMNMTPAERAASYPPSMFDVPVKDQIVRYGDNVGGAMMQRPKKPSWYDNPSENPFAKGMTQGQLHDDWIARHKIPVNKEGFIDFYHASPSKLENIKAGSYLETDANKAKFYAARDRGLNPEDMKLHKVTLPKYDFEIGGFPTLRNDYKVKTEALRQQDRK